MAGKLDQSLDEILKDRRSSARPRRNRRSTGGAKPSAVATPPVGGVKKVTKPAKIAGKANIPTGPSSGSGESKIIVSNLPADVDETQIKEYFSKTIGPVKKVLLTYGPNGQSRGVSTIIFAKPGSAAEAAKALDGVKVDRRPMKIEVILSAKDAPPPVPAKSLSDRVSQPKPAAKAQPKPATATKATAGKASTRGRGGRAARGRNAGRGKPKTAEELDAEMQDYFDTGAGNAGVEGDVMVTNGGAVQAVPSGGDTGMEDEIM